MDIKTIFQDKRVIIGVIVAVVIAIVAVVVFVFSGSKGPGGPGSQTGEVPGGIPYSDTKQPVPEDIVVPDGNGQINDPSVAAPTGVTNAAPGVSAKLRTFEIKAEGGMFKPSTVIVNKGDTVHINFTAVDRDYDMTLPDYGMKQTAKEGETKVFEFQAVDIGKYTYYCESCGGKDSTAKGYMIVAETQ